MARILFIHQNFPGQFGHLSQALAAQGHEVVALAMRERPAPTGVRVVRYAMSQQPLLAPQDIAAPVQLQLHRGAACAEAMQALAATGFAPELVIAHPGWGEALFVKDVFPKARLAVFAEFFYRADRGEYGFDPEWARPDTAASRANLRLKSTVHLHALHAADAAWTPTHWQHSVLPQEYRDKTRVLFDGIDTLAAAPSADTVVTLGRKDGATLQLTGRDEVITFVNRNLEPYRGFHVFMRALPHILEQRPQARCIILGGDEVSYGARAPGGQTWREHMLREVGHALPMDRVHFLQRIPYASYLSLLQISSCHVYLTYPFVLSWSCLEAMSVGCTVVGSATAPVEEVITNAITGMLTPFHDPQALAATVCDALAQRERYKVLGEAARRLVVQRYDLRAVCLPAQLDFISELL